MMAFVLSLGTGCDKRGTFPVVKWRWRELMWVNAMERGNHTLRVLVSIKRHFIPIFYQISDSGVTLCEDYRIS